MIRTLSVVSGWPSEGIGSTGGSSHRRGRDSSLGWVSRLGSELLRRGSGVSTRRGSSWVSCRRRGRELLGNVASRNGRGRSERLRRGRSLLLLLLLGRESANGRWRGRGVLLLLLLIGRRESDRRSLRRSRGELSGGSRGCVLGHRRRGSYGSSRRGRGLVEGRRGLAV